MFLYGSRNIYRTQWAKDFIAESKGQLVPDPPGGQQPKEHTIIEMEEVIEEVSPPVTPIREPVRQEPISVLLQQTTCYPERW